MRKKQRSNWILLVLSIFICFSLVLCFWWPEKNAFPEVEQIKRQRNKIVIMAINGIVWMVEGLPIPNCSIDCYFDRGGKNCNDPDVISADALIYQGIYDLCDPYDPSKVHILFHSESITHDIHRFRLEESYKQLGTYFNMSLSYKGPDDTIFDDLYKKGRKFEVFQITYAGWEPHLYNSPPLVPTEQKKKDVIAVVFISNCQSERLEYISKLKQYIKIDGYGLCFPRNEPIPECVGYLDSNNNWDYRRCITKRYKFYLAFENSNDDSYVTEKFFRCLMEGIVPVYNGASNIEKFLPTYGTDMKSAVLVKDFSTMEELAKHLQYLADNDDEYNKYLEWKSKPLLPHFKALIDHALDMADTSCRLCKKVLEMKRE